jgi:hypothetical protein
MIFDTEPGMTSPLRKRAIPFEGKADGKAGRMRYCLPLRGEGGRQSRPDEVLTFSHSCSRTAERRLIRLTALGVFSPGRRYRWASI